jgi:hypothetical protein
MTDGFSGTKSVSDFSQSKAEHVRHSNFLWFSCFNAVMRQRRRAMCSENSFVVGIIEETAHATTSRPGGGEVHLSLTGKTRSSLHRDQFLASRLFAITGP